MEIEEILELEEMSENKKFAGLEKLADRENEFQKCSFSLAVGHGLYEKGNMDERKSCKQFSNEGIGSFMARRNAATAIGSNRRPISKAMENQLR